VQVAGPRSVIEQLDSVFTRRMVLRVTDTLPQLVALDTARLGVTVRPVRVNVRVPLAPSLRNLALDTLPQ
jgi:hypothetical protein